MRAICDVCVDGWFYRPDPIYWSKLPFSYCNQIWSMCFLCFFGDFCSLNIFCLLLNDERPNRNGIPINRTGHLLHILIVDIVWLYSYMFGSGNSVRCWNNSIIRLGTFRLMKFILYQSISMLLMEWRLASGGGKKSHRCYTSIPERMISLNQKKLNRRWPWWLSLMPWKKGI